MQASRTDFGKVLKLHLPRTLTVVVAQDLEHFCLLEVKAERSQRNLELVEADLAIFVGILRVRVYISP